MKGRDCSRKSSKSLASKSESGVLLKLRKQNTRTCLWWWGQKRKPSIENGGMVTAVDDDPSTKKPAFSRGSYKRNRQPPLFSFR